MHYGPGYNISYSTNHKHNSISDPDITGIGGMAGAFGGIMIAKLAGMLFDHYKAAGDIRIGYGIMFMICAVAYIIAWTVMHLLVPKFKKLDFGDKN
jgi:ACS family hexuronate transporter-like MFS transporter